MPPWEWPGRPISSPSGDAAVAASRASVIGSRAVLRRTREHVRTRMRSTGKGPERVRFHSATQRVAILNI